MEDNLSKRKRLFLIDIYAIFYRAHFAMIRNPLINSKGMHTSALFGFTNQIRGRLRRHENLGVRTHRRLLWRSTCIPNGPRGLR